MARIVILGAGIGGVPMAFEMKEMVKNNHQVTVISDTPTFHFVPSNPWVPVGWRKPDDLKIELAPVMSKKGIEFIQKTASKVDPANNKVHLAKIVFEKYFMRKIRKGISEPFYERLMLKFIGIVRLK